MTIMRTSVAWVCCYWLALLTILIFCYSTSTTAQLPYNDFHNIIAKLSMTWTINDHSLPLSPSFMPNFRPVSSRFLPDVLIVPYNSSRVDWSANQEYLVRKEANFEFQSGSGHEGDGYRDLQTSFNRVPYMRGVDIETCKQACVNNFSCKTALFLQYLSDTSHGDCYLPLQLFTIISIHPKSFSVDDSAFIEVQKLRPRPTSASRIILISTCASLAFVLGVIGFIIYMLRRRRRAAKMTEESIRNLQGTPTWFAYEKIKTATENFNKKLGEGEFGAVFERTLEDGSKIAVKCLEGLGQVKRSFLAEVETIGSIHHVNLVRLRGFYAWKSKWFLVYEFMSNGSLDGWIYHGARECVLIWECRKKIILDVAKGLAYLHEDCRQKIIHLDIKPQNILLDSDFNAKVSDFGLSKLIGKDQSEVFMTMRGTPGYMAPEWLSSTISEKVDVYSFGAVLLEMLCGRKKFDRSWPEENWHLLDAFQKCWEQGTLLDLVDKDSEDMESHNADFVEMMKVAAWCLQYDFTKRPSMSMVVKVLEGMMEVDSHLSYNFTYPSFPNTSPEEYENMTSLQVEQYKNMTQLQASLLSGPR